MGATCASCRTRHPFERMRPWRVAGAGPPATPCERPAASRHFTGGPPLRPPKRWDDSSALETRVPNSVGALADLRGICDEPDVEWLFIVEGQLSLVRSAGCHLRAADSDTNEGRQATTIGDGPSARRRSSCARADGTVGVGFVGEEGYIVCTSTATACGWSRRCARPPSTWGCTSSTTAHGPQSRAAAGAPPVLSTLPKLGEPPREGTGCGTDRSLPRLRRGSALGRLPHGAP